MQSGRKRISEQRAISQFGEKFAAHLARRSGLNNRTLAEASHLSPDMLSKMKRGERLSGTGARARVRSIIKGLHSLGVLTSLSEANQLLLTIPAFKELDARDKEDADLITLLEGQTNNPHYSDQVLDALFPTDSILLRPVFMAPDLPATFIARPNEFEQLHKYLLNNKNQSPNLPVVLYGAGGFGKTMLAIAACYDQQLKQAYPDGILWVTLGQRPNMLASITKLYTGLTGQHLKFDDEEEALFALRSELEGKSCLIVLDDVWEAGHLMPFLQGGGLCTRLITTCRLSVAMLGQRVEVEQLLVSQAVQMLILPAKQALQLASSGPESLEVLAARLGKWPLLLDLAASVLRMRIVLGDNLEGAVTYLNTALDRRGITAFDQPNATARNQGVARTFEASLELLGVSERKRCYELTVLPADELVGLAVASSIWEYNEFETEELAQRLADLGLLRLNLHNRTLRLHSILKIYLAEQFSATELRQLYRRLG